MARVDFHQHVWPDELVEALRARRRRPRLQGTLLELDDGSYETDVAAHSPEQRIAELERDGLDALVASLQPTLADRLPRDLVDAYHHGILEAVAASDGALHALASGEVRDGFVGVCVSAAEFRDLAGLAPLLDAVAAAGQFVFVHPGPAAPLDGAPAWWAPGIDYVAQMQTAYGAWLAGGAERWPNVPVVFTILAGGAPFQLERLATRGLDVRTALTADIFLETSSYGRRALELTMATYGVTRIVYGSDAPVCDPRPMLRELKTFGKAVTAAVCEENPGRLLG
jgi:predicted TIM-barrel fold metal-dependent hydrolase